MAANMFSEQSKIMPAKEGKPNGSGIGQPPRECKSEVFDAFKKAPSQVEPLLATYKYLLYQKVAKTVWAFNE